MAEKRSALCIPKALVDRQVKIWYNIKGFIE